MRTTLILLAGFLVLLIVAVWYVRQKLTVNDVMTAYAQDAVDAARRNFQVDLDYSEESIKRLETIVGRQHDEYVKGPKPTEEQLNTFSKTWGAYLGEVIRKRHGGEWSVPQEGPFQGAYTLTVGKNTMSPPSRIWKRIVEGPENNLEHYFQAILRSPD